MLLPPLISSFSCFIGLFGNNVFQRVFCLALAQGMSTQMGLQPLWPLLASVGLTVAFVYLALMGAKGKLPFFLTGSILYLADFVYAFFLKNPDEIGVYVVTLVFHGIFLVIYVVGVVFYFKADRLLKAHPDVIMKS